MHFKIGHMKEKLLTRGSDPEAPVFRAYLRLDDNLIVNDISGYNALRWLSDMGGLAKALVFISGLLCAVLSKPLFFWEIMNSLFKVMVDPDLEDEDEDPSSGV